MTASDILRSLELIKYHLVVYSNIEIRWYNYTSYYDNKAYRKGLEYLELYYDLLSHVLSILNNGDELSDYKITESAVNTIINRSQELIYYYGSFGLNRWILAHGWWDDLGIWMDDEIWND